jgi:acyl-CoA synthetase (AMP-forming)/AMP-acid ligase II
VNLVEPILRHGRLQPTTIAIVDEDRSITYGELAELVQRTAGHLRALGVRRGDYVGLCLKDNWQHITALLAVAHMGAVAVQIETRSRPAERARIVDAFQLRLALVAPGSEANRLKTLRPPMIGALPLAPSPVRGPLVFLNSPLRRICNTIFTLSAILRLYRQSVIAISLVCRSTSVPGVLRALLICGAGTR